MLILVFGLSRAKSKHQHSLFLSFYLDTLHKVTGIQTIVSFVVVLFSHLFNGTKNCLASMTDDCFRDVFDLSWEESVEQTANSLFALQTDTEPKNNSFHESINSWDDDQNIIALSKSVLWGARVCCDEIVYRLNIETFAVFEICLFHLCTHHDGHFWYSALFFHLWRG